MPPRERRREPGIPRLQPWEEVKDISQVGAHREVRVRYLPAEPPASTLVEVSRLVRPGLMVEVDVVAAVPR
jgi:enamine deaminase RidA (YjgF/YER057c/UK114 family)